MKKKTKDITAAQETIQLKVDNEELFRWMLAAHTLDITLNQFVEQALKTFAEERGVEL